MRTQRPCPEYFCWTGQICQSVKSSWVNLGFSEQNIEVVGIGLEERRQRWAGTYLVLTEPDDFVSIAQTIRSGTDQQLEKDYTWLLRFTKRQRTMQALGETERRDAALFGLIMRRGIAGRIQRRAQESNGVVIGVATELNPRLLRCYGGAVSWLNIDVK